MDVRERDGAGRVSRVRGVERCKVRKDEVLNVHKRVGLITHRIFKAPNFVFVSSMDGGDVKEAGVSVPQDMPFSSGFEGPKIFFELKNVMEFSSKLLFKSKEKGRGV